MSTSFFGLLLCFYTLVAEVVFVLISWFLSLTLLADKGGYIWLYNSSKPRTGLLLFASFLRERCSILLFMTSTIRFKPHVEISPMLFLCFYFWVWIWSSHTRLFGILIWIGSWGRIMLSHLIILISLILLCNVRRRHRHLSLTTTFSISASVYDGRCTRAWTYI